MMTITVKVIIKLKKLKALTKDDILQPYISEENFRTSNVRAADVGYNLNVFD